jgi:hypothetical protein
MIREAWEYSVIELSYYEYHESELNELGKEGWELVAIVTSPGTWPSAYLKRKMKDVVYRNLSGQEIVTE